MRHLRNILETIAAAALFAALSGCSPAAQPQDSTTDRNFGGNTIPKFDASRAYRFLKDQVDLGPRVPGTAGHKKGLEFIVRNVEPYADDVVRQEFTALVNGKPLAMTNVIARFNSQADKHILLAAHWDTRPTADMEVTAEKRRMAIPGANDGASGTAVLLELARSFHKRKPDAGIVMVFLDGEDYGPGTDQMFLGSKHFAAQLGKSSAIPSRETILCGILLDMVGDSNLEITKESYSRKAAPDVLDKIWSTARRMGYKHVFTDAPGMPILDDHLPLIRAGVRCVDLIDFNYGPWHTLDDTPDKCSPDSLKAVGEVVAAVVYSEKTR